MIFHLCAFPTVTARKGAQHFKNQVGREQRCIACCVIGGRDFNQVGAHQVQSPAAAYNFYCDKNLENAHSALADTQATLEILEAQAEKYGEGSNKLDSLSQFEYKKTAEFLDDERKFRWWNGKAYMMFGKYARKDSLQEVARMDRGYLEWIVSAKFSEEVKTLVSNALQGHFPVFESEKDVPA